MISAWLHAENWPVLQALFSQEDELLVSKAQLVQLNAKIADECEPGAMVQWFKAKGMAFDIFATMAQIPRRPIGKLDKPKNNRLADLMASAAVDNEREQPPINVNSIPISPSLDPDSTPIDPFIDVNPTSNNT